MCIVYFDWRSNYECPIKVGANREENLNRPITLPVVVSHLHLNQPFYYLAAGQDRGVDGTFPECGTWLGVTDSGMVVAVTNRDDGVLHGPDQTKSRGLLCRRMLECPTFLSAVELCVRELKGGGYGGANYMILDIMEAGVVHAPGQDSVTFQRLSPGVHCITNLDMDDPDDERVQFIREALRPGLKDTEFLMTAQALCSHEKIVMHDGVWGTKASSVLAVGREAHSVQFRHYIGKPTPSSYVDFSQMTKNFYPV